MGGNRFGGHSRERDFHPGGDREDFARKGRPFGSGRREDYGEPRQRQEEDYSINRSYAGEGDSRGGEERFGRDRFGEGHPERRGGGRFGRGGRFEGKRFGRDSFGGGRFRKGDRFGGEDREDFSREDDGGPREGFRREGGSRFGGSRFGGSRFGGSRFGGDREERGGRFGERKFGGSRFGGGKFGGGRFGGGKFGDRRFGDEDGAAHLGGKGFVKGPHSENAPIAAALPNGQPADGEAFPKTGVRLNKFVANSGVCSRREADTLIESGVVTVNGEVVTEMGVRIDPDKDEVRFNGQRLKGEEKVYILMNKPRGYVTTTADPHADRTVMDLLRGCRARVFPVGRLDKDTTGVLMLTNDGDMAEHLAHPSYNKKKIYQAALDKPLKEEDRQRLLEGVELEDGLAQADELEYLHEDDRRDLGVTIHSGRNRIVRRMFDALGYEVRALDRVYFAGLTKRGVKKGEWRFLTEGEVNILKMGAYV